MNLSFIVTSFNVAPYIDQCLSSLQACLRPDDEIIVIDDGSRDDSPARISAALAELTAATGAVGRPIFFGTNTHGGVGIPANIGLDLAHGEGIVFIDGDDYLDAAGFNAARQQFERGDDDILIANYRTEDTASGARFVPADQALWAQINTCTTPEARRQKALSMISVPWRKFYRRTLITRHALRFPEGDFFFEDNPFHWDTCLKAEQIEFCDRVICYHRVQRPEQTMQARGTELCAIFTHYDSIRRKLPTDNQELHIQAMLWLLDNIGWQITQLTPEAAGEYALRASAALGSFDTDLWRREILPRYANRPGTLYAEKLRRGGPGAVLPPPTDPLLREIHKSLTGLEHRIDRLEAKTGDTLHEARAAHRHALGLANQQEAAALRCLLTETPKAFDRPPAPGTFDPATPAVLCDPAIQPRRDTLWIGAHKTGTTYLQHCLEASRPALELLAICYPELNRFRTDYTRPLLSAGRPEAAAEPIENWPACSQVLIFDENIPALVQDALGPEQLYPQAERRIGRMIDHLGLDAPRLVLGIRALDTYLPSLYCEALKSTPFRPFESFLPPPDPTGGIWRWSELVGRLRQAFPDSEFLVYRAEDLRGHEAELLAEVTGLPAETLTLAAQGQRPGFSQYAIEELCRQHMHNAVSPQDVAAVTARHPKGSGRPEFMPFSDSQRALLQAAYRLDQDVVTWRPAENGKGTTEEADATS